jgi:acyl dehydratase
MVDERIIGRESEILTFEVEKGAIRKFAEAIGDTNLLFLDEIFARNHGYASIIAPPTFPTTFQIPLPDIQIDLSHVLHGEQSYEYVRPIVAGDVLRCVNRVETVFERSGSLGHMTFIVIETRGEDLQGEPVFVGKSTIILH